MLDCPLLTGCELSGVFDDAVSRLEHTLDLAALRALRKPGVSEQHYEMYSVCRTNMIIHKTTFSQTTHRWTFWQK